MAVSISNGNITEGRTAICREGGTSAFPFFYSGFQLSSDFMWNFGGFSRFDKIYIFIDYSVVSEARQVVTVALMAVVTLKFNFSGSVSSGYCNGRSGCTVCKQSRCGRLAMIEPHDN